MPDAQAPVAPKPSPINVSPASLKGPPSVEPVAPIIETKPQEDLAPRFAELEKGHARLAKERRELAETRKSAKAEMDEVAKYKQLQAEAKRNPDKFLKSLYGDNYYDTLTRLKVDGVAPADLVASEMDERFKSVEQRLADKEAALDKKLSDYQAQEAQSAKNKYLNEAMEHAKANAEKYKLLAAFKDEGSYQSVAQKIESHFRNTTKQDANGNWVAGETLSPEAAALEVEKEISKVAEKFRAYFAAEAKTKTPDAPKRQDTTPRRDAAPPPDESGWIPPKSDRERLNRAFAAGEAHLASRQQH